MAVFFQILCATCHEPVVYNSKDGYHHIDKRHKVFRVESKKTG